MASTGQIGIYWGTDSFSIVETVNNQISSILTVPFDTTIEQGEKEGEVPDNLKFPAILKKALVFRSVKSQIAHLSVPTNDLIFRSFIIPLMGKSEIQNVVEFEITKYIPLKLDELVYTYHTVPHTENNQKNLRILFIAIRQARLEEMVTTINQAGLTLKNIEPAPVSLIHLLKKEHLISKNESSAILNLGEEGTEVIVVKNDTLTFMRKLNVSIDQDDLTTLQSTLQNEIRVSFNFFSRQNPNDTINRLIIISKHQIPNIEETLARDFNISVTFAPIEKFIPTMDDHQSISHLNALGTTSRKGKFSTKFFDLSDHAIAMQRSGKDPLESTKRYGVMFGILAACGIAIFLAFFLGNKMLITNKARASEIKKTLGAYGSLKIMDLKNKKSEAYAKLKNYINVRTDSQLALFLSEIPKIFPKGVWLESLEVTYDQSSTNIKPAVTITLSGKIYSSDPNQQFFLLSTIIKNLKDNKILNRFYNNVTRSKADRTTEDGYAITSFIITCDPK